MFFGRFVFCACRMGQVIDPNLSRILLIGGSGFVGRNLVEFFASRHHVIATYLRNPASAEEIPNATWMSLDARLAQDVANVVGESRPDIVVYVAGNKNVMWCESHQSEAMAVNGEGAANTARACQRVGCRMIYLSTDLVFDCSRGDYREEEAPLPTTAYGRTKLQGELWSRRECPEVAICRSGGIYGKRSPLLGWLASELRKGQHVEAFTDVRNTPTYVVNLAEMLHAIMLLSEGGIFHTVGSESVTRLEFFDAFARSFSLSHQLLTGATGGAERDRMLLQADSSLNCGSTRARINTSFDSAVSGMKRLSDSGVQF